MRFSACKSNYIYIFFCFSTFPATNEMVQFIYFGDFCWDGWTFDLDWKKFTQAVTVLPSQPKILPVPRALTPDRYVLTANSFVFSSYSFVTGVYQQSHFLQYHLWLPERVVPLLICLSVLSHLLHFVPMHDCTTLNQSEQLFSTPQRKRNLTN